MVYKFNKHGQLCHVCENMMRMRQHLKADFMVPISTPDYFQLYNGEWYISDKNIFPLTAEQKEIEYKKIIEVLLNK